MTKQPAGVRDQVAASAASKQTICCRCLLAKTSAAVHGSSSIIAFSHQSSVSIFQQNDVFMTTSKTCTQQFQQHSAVPICQLNSAGKQTPSMLWLAGIGRS